MLDLYAMTIGFPFLQQENIAMLWGGQMKIIMMKMSHVVHPTTTNPTLRTRLLF